MYKVIYRTIRESKNVSFYSRSTQMRAQIIEEKRHGRLLMEYTGFSEDLLVKRHVAIWRDKSDLSAFNENPVVKEFVELKEVYDTKHNHQSNIINEDIDE